MSTPALTPFVSAFSTAARDALVSLLSLDPSTVTNASLRPRQRPSTGWSLELTVSVSQHSVTLDIGDRDGARDAWFRTAHFSWSYRSTDADPFAVPDLAAWLNALKTHALVLDRDGFSSPEIQVLLDAVDRALPFAPVTDDSYRLLFTGPQGLTAIFWLGFRCDHDCVLCWQGRAFPEPPTEFFFTWLDEALSAGARTVSFSGGEPTLHPALPELIRRARARSAYVIVESNAAGLSHTPLRRTLLDAGVNELFASLHAADPALSDSLTRSPGAHARTLAGITSCLTDGLGVGVHCVVERANAPDLAAHARLIVDRFVRPFAHTPRAGLLRRVAYSLPTRYFDEKRYLSGLVPIDLVRPGLSSAVDTLRSAGVEVRITGMGGFPLCAVENPHTIAPATAISDTERQGRINPPVCAACALRSLCAGVSPLYLQHLGPVGLRPVTQVTPTPR